MADIELVKWIVIVVVNVVSQIELRATSCDGRDNVHDLPAPCTLACEHFSLIASPICFFGGLWCVCHAFRIACCVGVGVCVSSQVTHSIDVCPDFTLAFGGVHTLERIA